MEREKVDLSGAPATMLATLYGRALHSRSADPILRDPHAEEAVRRIDHDFRKTGLRRGDALSVALRAKQFDRMTADRLAAHPDVTVLHLACGLDSRGQRLDLPPGVEWYDIDFPEVIDLRRRLWEEPEHHHAIASSVTDPALLDGIPGDRRVLVVAEGLTMYLTEHEGLALLQRIRDHFPSGELIFDVHSKLAVRFANVLNRPVRAANAQLKWGVGSGAELANVVPGLEVAEELTFYDVPGIERLNPVYRAFVRALGSITALRRIALILRMQFGD